MTSSSTARRAGPRPRADSHREPPPGRRAFARIAAAGITFQGGSAAVDSSTVMAALAHQLTGSALAVGAVTAIVRIGWLVPPLFVGYRLARGGPSLPWYAIGGFGRGAWLLALAALLAGGGRLSPAHLAAGFLALWTAYAFTSGVVAVPYNDLVARAVPSSRRSRLLAVRFLGGGLLALAVAAAVDRLVAGLAFPASYAAVVGLAGALMIVSAALFVCAGEPPRGPRREAPATFRVYLGEGLEVWRRDRRFRRFVLAQWCGGAVMMAAPFYVVEAVGLGLDVERVAILLGAQTAGALAANPLWGWWGDRRGKASLLRGVVLARAFPPLAGLAAAALMPGGGGAPVLAVFAGVFFVLGALANGLTIAVVGYLMEISPADRRPAYTGYFNAATAPAYLLALAAGALADAVGVEPVLALAAAAALGQRALLRHA